MIEQIGKGLSVQSWPCGHATDSEEAIAFTEIKNVDCMVEKFPLAKANDAFSKSLPAPSAWTSLTRDSRRDVEWHRSIQSSNHDGVEHSLDAVATRRCIERKSLLCNT